MKCEICGLDGAVYFVQQIEGDSRTEIRLCASCAKERGLDLKGDISESLAKLLAAVPESKPAETPKDTAACPFCGTTLEDVRSTGSAGCPTCWKLFSRELLRKVYPHSRRPRHRGRLPARLRSRMERQTELEATETRLREALAAEDYESAARCRDRIRELEGGGSPHA